MLVRDIFVSCELELLVWAKHTNLQVALFELSLNGTAQGPGRSRREVYSREQVRQKGHEERQVQIHQLGLDEIKHRPEHDDLLRSLRFRTLESP